MENNEKDQKLNDLAKLTGVEQEKPVKKQNTKKIEQPSPIDGYRFVPSEELPFFGALYPKNWKFFYRCPVVDEIVNFSTVADDDSAKMVSTIESLIKKCWQIIDEDAQVNISTSEINDGDRLFFFLKLREFYLHDAPIQYNVYNATHLKSITVNLLASSLVYEKLKPSMLEKYNGRLISISMPNREEDIKFLTPTFEISRKILLYMQKAQKNIREKKVSEKDNIDKTFILFLPYLFVSGKEKMEQLELKLKKIMNDKPLFDRYMEIIGKMSLTNLDRISYEYEEEEFEVNLEFPSFKRMFIKQDFNNEVVDDI